MRLLGTVDPSLVLLANDGKVSEILDRTLAPAKLYYRIRNGEIVVGSLEELLR